MTNLLNQRDIEFVLYEMLRIQSLLERERYSEHSREVFDATLTTARNVAEKYFANHNKKGDENEPRFDGQSATVLPETKDAWRHFADAGFLAAHFDFADGGMQLPEPVLRTAMAYFNAANIATTAYPFLTIGVANLIHTFGDQAQRDTYLPLLMSGRCSGTMCLTEPDQGSALADITTSAVPLGDGSYRITGNKIFISGGDHDLTENIIHMVLAKIEGAPSGARGISLFICPKYLVNGDGSFGERNDVVLAGLLHKMGYRNTTSTALNFGEAGGAKGYLVGEPHRGLQYMFQMMNEARIGVGLGAAVLGYQGYLASLDYARGRVQGRLPSNKNPDSPQVALVAHADVRRMLLAQKAFSECALAMCLYASALFEDSRYAQSEEERQGAKLLLDLITPVVKSWPSKYGLVANDYAIQILGGAGYTREYPVEQLWRDNRLNPIHEGTEAIHGLDLLGRKAGSPGFRQLEAAVSSSIEQAQALPICEGFGGQLQEVFESLRETTVTLLAEQADTPDLALANATIYLDMFGNVFAAWIWLQQALVAERALQNDGLPAAEVNFYRGKIEAARYFYQWELPKIELQGRLLVNFDAVPFNMHDEWF